MHVYVLALTDVHMHIHITKLVIYSNQFLSWTGEALMTSETISHIQSIVAAQGSDAWWTLPIEQLLPPSLVHLAPTLVKGEDTMDVWFDSGSSWAGVVRANEKLNFPADLYLEGSDQHRGRWSANLHRTLLLDTRKANLLIQTADGLHTQV